MVDVEFINVTKKYGDVIAIKNVSFKIEDGEYVVLCGPTGAGKTTLLYLIAGLVKPDSGEILFNGQPINDVPPEERSVGFMFETFALFPHLNVMKNVTYGPWVRGVLSGDTIASAKEILELMHLAGWENAYPHELSGGMKQRVALARALVAEAKVLLLDEPFGALDAKIKMELRYEMRKLADSLKFTAVHATHDIEEALMLADKIIVLNEGKVEQIGTPVEVYEDPKSIFVANYMSEANFIEGRLIKKTAEYSIIDTKLDRNIRARPTDIHIDERVAVFIRSEDIDITPKKPQTKVNVFRGVVKDITFMGGFSRFEVELEESDTLLVIRKLGDVFKRFKEKQKVYVSFNPARAKPFLLEPGVTLANIINF